MNTENRFLPRLAGWCCYLAAGATIFGFVTFVTFFILGDPFGVLNDIASVVIALSCIPILLVLHGFHSSGNAGLSWVALVTGIAALLIAAVTQSMLVMKIIQYEQSAPATYGFGVFGISLLLYGRLSLACGTLPGRTSNWGIFAGLGYFLVVVGFLLGQQNHPLSYVGGLLSVVAFPAWATMLGNHLLASR